MTDHVAFADLLRLEAKGDDRFVIRTEGSGFLYGGLTMAVALRAAAATVDDGKLPMSLRASFLASGEWGGPHEVTVGRVMDSRGFGVRRVEVVNGGKLAVVADVVFHHPEVGPDEARVPAISLPPPEELPAERFKAAVEVAEVRRRPPQAPGLEQEHPYWCRFHDLADDPLLRACALAFVSDYMVIATPFPAGSGEGQGRSSRTLEHSLWFHRLPVDDDWVFADCDLLNQSGGRFLSRGHLQARDGVLLASFAQQGFVREIRSPG